MRHYGLGRKHWEMEMSKLVVYWNSAPVVEIEVESMVAAQARGEAIIEADMRSDTPDLAAVEIHTDGRTLNAVIDGDCNVEWEG